MTDPILPPADALLTPAIDAIVAAAPASLKHFNSGGRWADLPALWRAQLLLNLARQGDEVQSARLRFSKGPSLRALAASEFNTTLPTDPQIAYATLTLTRPNPAPTWLASTRYGTGAIVQPPTPNGLAYQAQVGGITGGAAPSFSPVLGGTTTDGGVTWLTIALPVAPAGVIRSADRFRKNADPNATPIPVGAAAYAPVAPVYVQQGQLTTTISLRATVAGADANVPYFVNVGVPTSIGLAQPLSWDKTWTTSSSVAAGGSSGLTDPVLVAAARAYSVGQFGPTLAAVVAGVLRQQSVRHYAIFPASQAVPYAQAYLTDESWGQSTDWLAAAAQTVADTFQGFGCRTRYGGVQNQQIALATTLVLQSSDDLNYTDAIDQNVRTAAESYFNDRPDWYRFRLAALRSLLSKCDRRIQQCTSVVVTDALTGAVVPEPANTFGLSWLGQLTHFYLTDRNVTTSYRPPT